MRKILFYSCLFAGVFVYAQEVINLNAVEFKNDIESKEVIILDVRTPQELNSGTIENASFINFYDEKFAEKIKLIQKGKEVYVYCKSGGRSSSAAQMLAEQGQFKVYNLMGGISAWKRQGYPLVRELGAKDQHIKSFSVEGFDSLLVANDYLLVDFHTQWCLPCKKMIPILDDLEKENLATVIRIDVDQAEDLAEYYDVQAVPTLILFYKKEQLWKNAGFIAKDDLRKVLTRNKK